MSDNHVAHQPGRRLGGDLILEKIEMMMNTLRSMAVLGMAAGTTNAWVLDPTEGCQNEFDNNIGECTDQFGPEGEHPDPNSHSSCTDSAEAGLEACLAGADSTDLWVAWRQYIEDLIRCAGITDPVERAGCVSGSTIIYKWRLDNPPTDDDECGAEVLPASMALIESLKSGSSANGFLTLAGDSSISFTAGVSTQPGGEYDVRDEACLKSALLIAIYQTKEGGVARPVDADMDLSDGVSFDYFVHAPSLVHATDVSFVVLYRNQSGLPEFVEFAMMEIESSPISGDWNRDQSKDIFDVIDYFDGYEAQTQRSDISGDGIVDTQDAIDFVNEYIQD